MSAIQVKNVPADLHESLRKRARAEGRNIGEYVLDVLRRDMAMPTTREWLGRLACDEPTDVPSERIVELIHEGRDQRAAQILAAVADSD